MRIMVGADEQVMEAFCLPECIVGGAFVAAAGRRNRARRRHGNGEGNYGDVLGADDDEKQLVEHGLLVPAILFIILLPPTRWLLCSPVEDDYHKHRHLYYRALIAIHNGGGGD